ncbi:unnamed protein product [Caenorhabditis brenneri]
MFQFLKFGYFPHLLPLRLHLHEKTCDSLRFLLPSSFSLSAFHLNCLRSFPSNNNFE